MTTSARRAEAGVSTRFWDPPAARMAPGEKTLRALIVYATDNAYLRLRLDDQALMDREWHAHRGRWIPSPPSDVPIDRADLPITHAARLAGVGRTYLAQAVTRGELPSKQYLNGRRVRLEDVQAWDRTRQRARVA